MTQRERAQRPALAHAYGSRRRWGMRPPRMCTLPSPAITLLRYLIGAPCPPPCLPGLGKDYSFLELNQFHGTGSLAQLNRMVELVEPPLMNFQPWCPPSPPPSSAPAAPPQPPP